MLLIPLAIALATAQTGPFDLIIANGRVIDGTGATWYRADIGVRGSRIAAIGPLAGQPARRTIDARGKVVSPGFIDLMGSTSLPFLNDPDAGESKLRQGITTMLAGEGGSAAPQNARTLSAEARAEIGGYKWSSFAELFALLEKRGVPLNVVHNVGAAQARRVVLGENDVRPTPAQLEEMKRLVRQAMEDGAVGLSTALIYPPGTYATTDELVELNKVVAEFGGVYFTHMRNESFQLLDAIRESIAIGERAGTPVHIFHLKAAGQENWPLMSKAIALIEEARARGIDVTADIYPYIRNGIGLGSFLHPRHYVNGAAPFLRTLSSPDVRVRLRAEVENTADWENWYRHVGKNWDNVLIATVSRRGDKRLEGKSLAEAAKLRGTDEWTTFFDLVQEGGVNVNPRSMNEEQKHLALRAPFVAIDTDAGPVNPKTATNTHPRAFGTFPRVLAKYVREEKVIPLETAVHKMTALPANRLKLFDRGRIALGMIADLVVFDPATVEDRATFTQPMLYPTGIPYVVVNGRVAIDNERPADKAAGELIRVGRKQ